MLLLTSQLIKVGNARSSSRVEADSDKNKRTNKSGRVWSHLNVAPCWNAMSSLGRFFLPRHINRRCVGRKESLWSQVLRGLVPLCCLHFNFIFLLCVAKLWALWRVCNRLQSLLQIRRETKAKSIKIVPVDAESNLSDVHRYTVFELTLFYHPALLFPPTPFKFPLYQWHSGVQLGNQRNTGLFSASASWTWVSRSGDLIWRLG